MNCFSKSGILKYAQNSHIQVRTIIHRVIVFSSVDSPDDREDCFRMVGEMWLETRADCVTIQSFQLLVFPGKLIFWAHKVSPQLFYKQPVSLSHLLHSQFQIRKGPHLLTPLLQRQVTPWLCPSTRQGMHLAVALKNSTLRWILFFSHPAFGFPMNIPRLVDAI